MAVHDHSAAGSAGDGNARVVVDEPQVELPADLGEHRAWECFGKGALLRRIDHDVMSPPDEFRRNRQGPGLAAARLDEMVVGKQDTPHVRPSEQS